jgi:hypothetical protein
MQHTTRHDALNLTKLPASALEARPVIPPARAIPTKLTPFSRQPDPAAWCHFFLDDYKFERVWNQLQRYLSILEKFAGALSPDFSLYTSYPEAEQRMNLGNPEVASLLGL